MHRLLLLEDDPAIAKALKLSLTPEGYTLVVAPTIAEGARLLESEKFQAYLLDINLPDGNGIDFCKEVRAWDESAPILFLTAQVDEDHAVRGLGAGANDFIRKPFGTRELLARLKLLLGAKRQLHYRSLRLDRDKRTAEIDGQSVELRRREFDVLVILVENAEKVVSREQLLKALEVDGEILDRSLDSHLSRLRTKLKSAGARSLAITSVYGHGYKLEAV